MTAFTVTFEVTDPAGALTPAAAEALAARLLGAGRHVYLVGPLRRVVIGPPRAVESAFDRGDATDADHHAG